MALTFERALVCHASCLGGRLGRGDHGGRAVGAVDAAGALGHDATHIHVEDAVWRRGELGFSGCNSLEACRGWDGMTCRSMPVRTSTAEIEDHVVLLRIEPLHDRRGQLGHERGRVLIGLVPLGQYNWTKTTVLVVYWGKRWLASEDQLSCCPAAMLSVSLKMLRSKGVEFRLRACVSMETKEQNVRGARLPLYTFQDQQSFLVTVV